MGWEWKQGHNLEYLTIPEWEQQGIQIGFSSRNGGFSKPPYNSLNIGLHVGDDPVDVINNRAKWLQEWEAGWTDFAVGQQVHGTKTAWLTKDCSGRGSRELDSALPELDGLLTRERLGLMAFFADCVPLFFYHPKLKAAALAHAGWKGTAHKIGQAVLKQFVEAGGAPEECWVAIGPSIGACCYEVDEKVAAVFRENFAEIDFLKPNRPGHYTLDLWAANQTILMNEGVNPKYIWTASLCTSCNTHKFFSHRAEGPQTGRMAGWIRLP